MARVELSSPPTQLGDGILQLQNGVPMDGTLRFVTDQNNTASPLKLSTTLVQTLSTLKITTADNPYIDAEDNSGNNRFTIGRDPASQQVNLDFASNPTGSTTNVGAIRTYKDGVNLSEVMTFREDGFVGFGTILPTEQVQIESNTQITSISSRCTLFLTSTQTSAGLKFGLNGSSVGSIIQATQGTGVTSYPLHLQPFGSSVYICANSVFNASGQLTIGNGVIPLNTAQLNIRGGGSTSATTSLLVQNSGGTQSLKVTDSGLVNVGDYASNFGALAIPFDGVSFGTKPFIVTQRDGTALLSMISNTILEISAPSLRVQPIIRFQNVNTGLSGPDAQNINQSSILLSGAVNAYNGTSQNDACNLVYIENRGSILQAAGSINWIKMAGNVYEAGGGGNKWCTGIYYNPTFTGGTLLDNSHYCYHATSGQMMVNTTSPQSSAQLQVDSTTRGFLPPRMTDAQIRAIVAPVNGLVAFNTDINVLCCYQAGIWVKFSHSPM